LHFHRVQRRRRRHRHHHKKPPRSFSVSFSFRRGRKERRARHRGSNLPFSLVRRTKIISQRKRASRRPCSRDHHRPHSPSRRRRRRRRCAVLLLEFEGAADRARHAPPCKSDARRRDVFPPLFIRFFFLFFF
jgi:hypothetical protein